MSNQCPNCKTDLGDLFAEMDQLAKLPDGKSFQKAAKCCDGTHIFQRRNGMYYLGFITPPAMIGGK